MPNLYYDNQDPPVPLSRTRAGNEVSDRDRLEQAFDKLPTEDELKSGAVNYTVDTGVADIYVVTIPYATEYFEGLNILFKILNANTGASTIDVNGLGPKSMVSPDGTALEVGDLVAGGATSIVYDGAVFRLVIAASANARSAADAAAASAAAALVSENAALVSENAALASETAAGLSETAAGVSETNSAANAAAALVSENAALVSEGNASTSEGNSSTSAAASLVSENAASVSEGNASTSETNSAASEAAALVSQDAAEDWAIRPEDNPVPVVSGGDGSTTFSSLHWAAKAAAFALAIDLSSPAAIGDVTPNTGDFTDMTLTGSLLQVADAYHNWGATVGDSGYGIRDSSGTMQFKNSAGAWASFDSLGDDLSSPPPIGDVAPNTGAFTTLSTTGALTIVSGTGLNTIVSTVGNDVVSRISAPNLVTQGRALEVGTSSATFASTLGLLRVLSDNVSSTGTLLVLDHDGTGKLLDARQNVTSKFIVNNSGSITQATGLYHNFSLTLGDGGYGFRDLAGVMQFKDSGGAWVAFGTGGAFDPSNPGPIGDGTPSTGAFTSMDVAGGISRFSRADATPAGTASTNMDDGVFGSTDTANTGITIFSSGVGNLAFGDVADVDVGRFRFAHATNNFDWVSAGTVRMDLDGSGNLRQNASAYHNWGATVGDSGYGFRDLAGEMQFKDSGGAWAGFGTGGAFDPSSPGPIGDVTPSTGAFTTGAFTSLTLAASVTTGVGFDATFNSLGVGGDGVYLHTTSPAWEDGALLHVDLAFVNTREKSLIKIEDVFGAQKTIFLELEQKGGGSIGGLIHARSDAHQQTAFLFDLASQTAPGLDMFSDNTFSSGLGFAHFSLTNTGNQSTAPVVRIDQAGVFGTGLQIRNTIGGGSGLQVIHDGGNSNNPAVNIIVNSLDGGIGLKVGGTPTTTGKLLHIESTGNFGSQGVDRAAVIMEHTNVLSAGVVLLVKTVGTGPALNVIGGITVEGNTVHSSGQTRHEQNSFTTNIDCDLGHVFSQTLTTNRTFTFSNIPASGTDSFVTLILTNAGDFTITWPLSVDWAGGSPPIFTSGEVDIVTLVQYDGGSTWYASAILDVK